MYQILLVEDDAQIREIISDYFKEKGGEEIGLKVAKDGLEGLHFIQKMEFDLVLLDIMMPGMDGFSLCQEIRRKSVVPIIFLTARNQEEDLLYGYKIGCDDYMIKPFSVAELYVKVQAMLRRAKGELLRKVIRNGKIELHMDCFQVFVDKKEIRLAPKEYELLRFLMENKGRVLSRNTLLDRIWGYDYEGTDRVVDNHIKKLRKALGTEGRRIKTVITQGYRWEDE
ncbi:MAG: response regulator transcription factor [Lachnospiraceae bacterium]|nr:response regulator transcription factor [Lachnospiraceae bacterium]